MEASADWFAPHGGRSGILCAGSPTPIRLLFTPEDRAMSHRRLHVETLEPRETPASLVVNTLADAVADDNLLSLREAVNAVNAGDATGLDAGAQAQITGAFGAADEITFATPGTITLSGTQLTLSIDVTITGGATVTVSGNDAERVFEVGVEATAAMSGLTITGGNAFEFGGGIRNAGTLALSGVTLSGNTANRGGGIYNAGTLSVTGSTLTGNSATQGEFGFGFGGGIFNATDGTANVGTSTLTGNSADDGGGIFNQGPLTVTASTLGGNSAQRGGGLFSSSGGTPAIRTSTFSGNTASVLAGGVIAGGALEITDSTFSGNSSPSGGAVTVSGESAALTLTGTILANSPSGGDLALLSGGTASGSFNLVEDGTGVGTSFTNSLAADPLLSALGSYGGPTQTFALLSGSPALNAGTGSLPDQRGIAAVGTRDIGAFESRGFTLTVAGGSGQATPTGAAFPDPLRVQVTANEPGEPVDGGVVAFSAPASGASAALSGSTATVAGGFAQVTATANATPGTYQVTAALPGTAQEVAFDLTNLNPVSVAGTMTVAGTFAPGGAVTYTVVLTNSGASAQGDNPGSEFAIDLPVGVTLVSASATSGLTATGTGSNTVAWNGGLGANGGTVTITIRATVAAAGGPVSAQGFFSFDADANGENETSGPTDDPGTAAVNDPTVFVVQPAPPVLSVGPVALAEGNAGTTAFVFTVILSFASEQPVTVTFATSDGTATAGGDYTATTQTVTIPAGQRTATVTVPVTGDTTVEPNETFTVTLSAPSGATIGTATATGTITNDDAAPITPAFIPLTAAGAGGAPGSQPAVKVYNADGSERFSFLAYAADFIGGARVATGDVNGDGVDDIVTGAGPLGSSHVKVFDGRTGAELLSFFAFDGNARFGVFVAAADLDGDGRAEVIAGAGQGGAPHVKVFDGATAAERLSFFAFDGTQRGGVTVAGHLGQIVTGSGIGVPSEVRVFDATATQRLRTFSPYGDFAGGVNVATVGERIVTGTGPGAAAHVKVFAADGSATASFFAFPPLILGGGANVGGRAEEGRVLVGTGPFDGPQSAEFTPDGQLVNSFAPFDPRFLGGVFVG
jgi:fibronectin-binding autotransporter adhesin